MSGFNLFVHDTGKPSVNRKDLYERFSLSYPSSFCMLNKTTGKEQAGGS